MKSPGDQDKHSSEAAAFRQALRREHIAAREALPAVEHARTSAAVLDHLHGFLTTRLPSSLAFYWPIRAEVDCTPLVRLLVAQGWRACLPFIVARGAAMVFREWTPLTNMVAGEYGIPTVGAGESMTPDVVLLPVNVFDHKGYRLGYGGGYFDRTLAALAPRPFVIGVGFELGRADSIRPHAQDLAMNAVVTDRGVETFPDSP
jgi:5-formyltetrahydrofolate cyclo-ligase